MMRHCDAMKREGSGRGAPPLRHLDDVARSMELFREHSLLGNYETSLTYFDNANDQITLVIKQLTDPAAQMTWRRIKGSLNKEANVVRGLMGEMHSLTSAPAATSSMKRVAAAPSRVLPPMPNVLPRQEMNRGPAAEFQHILNAEDLVTGRRSSSTPPISPRLPGWAQHCEASVDSQVAINPRRKAVRATATESNASSSAASVAAKVPADNARRMRRKPPVPAFARKPPSREERKEEQVATSSIKKGSCGGGDVGESAVGRYIGSGDSNLVDIITNDIMATDAQQAITFADIAGLESAKKLLEEAVVWPLLAPELFQGLRRPWKGVLMFGPPGTGKTLLARALAAEYKTTFFNVSASTLASKYRGESEKLVRVLFDMARHHAPSIIFFDEIDSLGGARGQASEHEASRRVKSELLTQMDGAAGSGGSAKFVMVLGATNFPWGLDEALRRRLEKRIFIPLPDRAACRQLLEINLRSVNTEPDVSFDALAAMCDGYSGADITNVCRDASMMYLRRRMQGLSMAEIQGLDKVAIQQSPVSNADFQQAFAKVSSSVSAQDQTKFHQWMAEFGSQ